MLEIIMKAATQAFGGYMADEEKNDKPNKIYFNINQDINLGRFSRAKSRLESLREMEGDTARVFDLLGIFAMIDKNYPLARKMHEKAVSMDPASLRFRLNLGNAYMLEGNWEKACETFLEITAAHPNYAPAQNNLAMALFRLNKDDEALAHVEKMKSLMPSSPAPYRLEALYYYQKGQYEKALLCADRLIPLEPENPLTFIILGQIFDKLGRYADAAVAFEKVRQLAPEDLDNLKSLAFAYGDMERFDLAKPLLEEVVRRKPDDGPALKGLALICRLLGDEEMYKKYAQAAEKLGLKVL